MAKYNDIDMQNWRDYSEIITDSLWLIDRRDNSGAHTADYHGNFIPQIPHQLLSLIGYLLEHFRSYTYMGILGLVFASPVVVFLQMEALPGGILAGIIGVLCLMLGILVANRMSDRGEKEA